MDHEQAVRLRAVEKYVVDEFQSEQRNQFEEHMFGCVECARDIRVLVAFIETSKGLLVAPAAVEAKPNPAETRGAWVKWMRRALPAPALAVLIIVLGYENLVQIPTLRRSTSFPQILPSALLNIATRGAPPTIVVRKGREFSLLLDLPPNAGYTSYLVDFSNPKGNLEWSLVVPTEAVVDDRVMLRAPGSQQNGTYVLKVRGVTVQGTSPELGQQPLEVSLEK